ncbi:MAG: hypothetical protein IPP77_11870 [Bacteroidetes bacterium]|nr:hypothetical protein [Bacteroidota bacterium]
MPTISFSEECISRLLTITYPRLPYLPARLAGSGIRHHNFCRCLKISAPVVTKNILCSTAISSILTAKANILTAKAAFLTATAKFSTATVFFLTAKRSFLTAKADIPTAKAKFLTATPFFLTARAKILTATGFFLTAKAKFLTAKPFFLTAKNVLAVEKTVVLPCFGVKLMKTSDFLRFSRKKQRGQKPDLTTTRPLLIIEQDKSVKLRHRLIK